VASAGPYANMHLVPDRSSHQHPTTQSFTDQMPFLGWQEGHPACKK